jgi:hypothetical protein
MPQCGEDLRRKKAMCANSAEMHDASDPEGRKCIQDAEHECYSACQAANGKSDDWVPYLARKMAKVTEDAQHDPKKLIYTIVVVGAAIGGGVWLYKKYKKTGRIF